MCRRNTGALINNSLGQINLTHIATREFVANSLGTRPRGRIDSPSTSYNSDTLVIVGISKPIKKSWPKLLVYIQRHKDLRKDNANKIILYFPNLFL
jgi:hypothetical protein